jgi:hypothetical protein
MAAIGLALCPTKYQIFNDRIRIVLGYILHFDIPFNNRENIDNYRALQSTTHEAKLRELADLAVP